MENSPRPTPTWPTYLVYGLGWSIGVCLDLAYLGLALALASELHLGGKVDLIVVTGVAVSSLLAGGQFWVLFTTFREHRRTRRVESSMIAKLWGWTIMMVFLGVGSCVAIIFAGYSSL